VRNDIADNFEHWMRNVTASMAAQEMVLDFLISNYLFELPAEGRAPVAEALMKQGVATAQFRNLAKDDFHAERLADMVILAQQKLTDIISRAQAAAQRASEFRDLKGS